LVVQLLSGVVWAAYDLGVFLLIFENIGAKERTSVLASYNFVNAVAMVGGSLLGGVILNSLHETTGAYMTLFGLSAIVRIFTLALLWRVTAERRHPVTMDMRSLAVRPQMGGIERPVLAALNGEESSDKSDDSAAVEALEGVGG
jgi:MFS family permease